MRKIEMGDSWRSTFKNTMWVSVVIFEVVMIIFVVTFSVPLARSMFHDVGAQPVVIVLGIILVTLLNEIIHSAWACIAYMFDDIARSRRANEELLEYVMKLNGDEKEKEQGLLGTLISALRTDNGEEPQKRIRPIEERSSVAAERWACKKCGCINSVTSSFCKDCGEYK